MISILGDMPEDIANCKEMPYPQRYRLIRQAGFDGVLIWWDEEDWIEDFRSLPEVARREGLFVENVHVSFDYANDFWEDNAAGQSVFDYYMRSIQDCGDFEIPTMVMHTGRAGNPLPPLTGISVERWERMIDRAEKLNVNIAVENQGDPYKCVRASEILEMFDSPKLGICYDSGHANVNNNNGHGRAMLKKFGHRLKALHLHDNDGSGDQHIMPFDGNIDWADLMAEIKNTGYTGPTTLELDGGYPHLSIEEYLKLAYERALKIDALRNKA